MTSVTRRGTRAVMTRPAGLAGRVTLPDFATTMTPADVQPWSQAAAQFKVTDSVVPPASIITRLK